jgi:hypothetical protein
MNQVDFSKGAGISVSQNELGGIFTLWKQWEELTLYL